MSLDVCPSCQQPYLKVSSLLNPDRTIYIHRQSQGSSKNPIDWCVDPSFKLAQQSTLARAIEGCNNSNQVSARKVEKDVARSLELMAQLGSKRSVMIPKTGSHDKEITSETVMGFSHQGKRGESMAFVGFDLVKLREEFPAKGIGRVGKPSVAISDKGRLTFSAAVSEALAGCKFVLPSRDKDNNLRVRFDGHGEAPKGKENQVFEISRPKPDKKGKVQKGAAIQAIVIFKALGYDFAKAGNQTYEVEKFDAEKHTVIFSLPATLPTPKAKAPRVKKVKAATPSASATGSVVNGAAAPGPVPVAALGSVEDELVIQE